MDLGVLYGYAISLFNRFMNWHFTVWGQTVHVYSIFLFCLLAVMLFKFIEFLKGV